MELLRGQKEIYIYLRLIAPKDKGVQPKIANFDHIDEENVTFQYPVMYMYI